jgi:hypothetical protein
MKKVLTLSFILCILFVLVSNEAVSQTNVFYNKTDNSFFIENKGQWDSEVLYLSRSGGMNVWITKSGVFYDYYQIIRDTSIHPMTPSQRMMEDDNSSIKGHIVKLWKRCSSVFK